MPEQSDVDQLIMDNTREQLHTIAVDHGWPDGSGNKATLAEYILLNPMDTTEVAAEYMQPTRAEWMDRTAKQLAAEVIEKELAKPIDAIKMNKLCLLDLLFPDDAESQTPSARADAKALARREHRQTIAGQINAACPTLVLFHADLRDEFQTVRPDVDANLTVVTFMYVASLVLDDCRLSSNPKAAMAALHNRNSANNRRFRIVLRRVINMALREWDSSLQTGLLTSVVKSAIEFFPNDESGELSMQSLFAECRAYFTDKIPGPPIAAPLSPSPENEDDMTDISGEGEITVPPGGVNMGMNAAVQQLLLGSVKPKVDGIGAFTPPPGYVEPPGGHPEHQPGYVAPQTNP